MHLSLPAFFVGLAAFAVLGFASRRFWRACFAPPHGLAVLAATWATALGVCAWSLTFPPTADLLRLAAWTGAAFAALLATLLWRDARNRAHGRPPTFMVIPEPLRLHWRIGMGIAAGVCVCGAAWFAGMKEAGRWEVSISLLLAAFGFGRATIKGHLLPWQRDHLGLGDPLADALPPDRRPPPPLDGAS